MRRILILLFCLVVVADTASIGAANAGVVGRLPKKVSSTLTYLLECSKHEAVRSYGRESFAYCGAPVTWYPARTDEMRKCLGEGEVRQAQKLPSYLKQGATSYNVLLNCSNNTYLTIDIEALNDSIWIGGIVETLP